MKLKKTSKIMDEILFTLSQATNDLEYRELAIRCGTSPQFDIALSRLRDNGKIDYYLKFNKYGKGFPYWYIVNSGRPKTDHSNEKYPC